MTGERAKPLRASRVDFPLVVERSAKETAACRSETIALAGLLALATPALADDDRAPTTEELIAIEAVLRDAGYVSWDDIELDGGVWEVDDARKADGTEHDLVIDPATFRIVDVDE